MKIGSTVLLLIPYRFHIIFEPARLRIACRQVRLSVCRQAGTPADRSAGKLDGRQVGARAGLQASKSTARCPSSYPKAFRLLPKSGSSKVCFELLETFRVTPKALPPGCLSEVGQPVLTLWCSWSIPCTLCRIILSCCTAWYVRCRAMPQPICGCLSPVPAHG